MSQPLSVSCLRAHACHLPGLAAWMQGSFSNLQMNGQEVFKFAVRAVPTVRSTVLHCTALHCAALCCTALCCTARHCTVLDVGGSPGRRPLAGSGRLACGGRAAQPSWCWHSVDASLHVPLALTACPCHAAALPPPCPGQVIEAALADAGMEKQEIDWLVMHQANMRIMSAAADRLGVPTGGLGLAWAGGEVEGVDVCGVV